MKKILLISILMLLGSQASRAFTWYDNGDGWQYTFMGWIFFNADNWAYSQDDAVWFFWNNTGSGINYYADYGTTYFTHTVVYQGGSIVTLTYFDEGWYFTTPSSYPNAYIFTVSAERVDSFGTSPVNEGVNAWSTNQHTTTRAPRAAKSYYED